MNEGLMLNLHAILAGAWRRRYLLATCIVIMPVLGLLVGLLSPRTWQTHTSVLVQETAKLNPFLEDLSVATNLDTRFNGLSALLHSRHVLGGVAEELGMVKADSDPQWREQVIAELSASLTLQLLSKDMLQLTYRSGKPERMAETLKLVRQRFLDQLLAPEQSSLVSSEQFLEQQLQERRRDLLDVELRLAEYKRKHAAELPSMLGANVTSLRQLKESVAKRRTALAGALAAKASQESRLAQVNPVIGRLEEQIVEITSELALLRSRYTEEHTAVQGAVQKLRRLEEERSKQIQQLAGISSDDLDQLWRLASGSERDDSGKNRTLLISQLEALQIANNRVVQLQKELADQEVLLRETESQVSNFADVERGMTELERELASKRELYDDLQLRFEKARVTGALGRFEQPERIKIIDEAYQPLKPSNLPLLLFVVAGLVAGIVIGAGLALLSELMDSSVRRRDRLEALLNVPVISRIPCVRDSKV